MKTLMSMLLGLSLVAGITTVGFAGEDSPQKKEKKKKNKKTKKNDTKENK